MFLEEPNSIYDYFRSFEGKTSHPEQYRRDWGEETVLNIL